MGAAEQVDIRGAKGGSSTPKTPTEATDSLRSTNLAKILIAVGEGEFEGVPTAADIYLDNTPISDASGNVNFPNVKWEWRSGSVEQDYIPGIPSVENETTVNVELRSDSAWVRSITNTQLSAVRVRLAWPALQRQDSEGNVGGYRIEYAVDLATDGGAYQQVLAEAVDGKTTTRYERSRRIDLPAASSGWQIRVRRLTPNQNTNRIADTMILAGLTDVIDEKLRYPNTALLFIEFDAEQFSNIPAVTIKCKGRKWQVPSNYDPVARTYSGVWDGTFKQAWTNNPAWVTYGICTADRFGLGKRIKPFMVDKWELYRIAQYCDQLVPDGVGGQEPRFLCDMNLQGKPDAWTLLRDISAIYRGMTYWAQGQLVMQADMPRAQDFDYVFTRANVIDGELNYGSASAKTRYTRAIVSYDNPANNYDTDVTAYSDLALQRRFDDRPTEISAIGCTRASEAQRRGKWVVMSNNQDRTVTFKTGMEGAIPLPGYIIPIADSLLAGREIGGRISAASGRVVTLDRDTSAKAGDRLIINLPSGHAEGRSVQSVNGRDITVTTSYSQAPDAQLQWALDADDLAIPLFRVLSTKRTTEGDYEISALQYEPSKFAYIDTGARLEERPISVIPITVVPAPASVTLTSHSAIDQGIAISTMTITWPAVNGAVAYDVEWRKDNGNWIRVQRTGTTSVDITGIYSGAYLARVRAVSAFDITSIWRTSQLTQLNGKEGLPPAVTSLTTESLIFGIGLKWTFPPGAEDTQRTEIWYGEAPDLTKATKLADLAYPQSDYTMQGLRAGQEFFFWARLVDRTGNVGPWFPGEGNGVNGEASSDADDILDYLTGQITESELGKELLSEIGKIGGEGPGSVNERLDQIRTDLGDQITGVNNTVAEVQAELQAQIDQIGDLADSMPYKPAETYITGQGVLGDDGIIYQAIKAVPISTPPPNTAFWLNVGQAVQTANGLAARVSTAETKITSIEGVNTAQATQISGLQTSLTGKADSSVVSSLSSRVTTAENSISSQGTAITGLQNSVAGKADASTVQALSNKVTQQGTDLTAAGSAITTINANLASVGGENLFYNPSFDKPWPTSPALIADGWSVVGGATNLTTALVASTLDTAGKAQRVNLTLQSATAYADLGANVDVEPKVAPGTVVTASAYFRSTVGIIAQMYIQWRNAAGTIISTDGPANLNGSDSWQRISRTSAAAPAGTVSVRVLLRTRGPVDGTPLTGFSEWDRAQFELAPTVSGWKDNGKVTASDLTAQAAATTALTGRVTQTETGLTSVSGQITTLNNNLGSAGGDNLLPNSSFELPAPIDASRPQYWRGDMGDGALPVFTWVDSPLPSSTKALRVSKPSLIVNGYIGPTFAPEDGPRPKVVPGQSYTLSAYVRLSSSGARFAMYMVFVNEAGTVVSAPQLPETVVGTTFTRLSMTAIAPAGATRLQIYPARLLNRSGAVATDMWMEVDNVQLQEGTIPTAYSPSVQGVETQVSATSTAVASLQSTVGQQGTLLTSQSADITSLKNTIGSAAPFVAGYAWEFLNTNRNWIPQVSGSTMTPGALYSTVSKYTQIQATDSFGKINGSENPYLRIRLRRKATSRAQAAIYWANEDGGLAEARRFNWNINLATEDWQDVELDLSGHTGWNGKTGIWAIRLDMMVPADANGIIDIAYIAVGRRSAAASASALDALTSRVTSSEGTVSSVAARTTTLESTINNGTTGLVSKASAQALNNLQTTVTSQGNSITSAASQINNLNAVVGNQSAAIENHSQVIADSQGKLSASYVVKMGLTSDGRYYTAGFGVGLDNSAGAVQSRFIVNADQFSVLNGSADLNNGGTVTSPFIISGGQVFISSLFVQNASITNAKIADAAITNAKIADAQITAAKIGVAEVDTLRIRGNAVTVPVSATTPGTTGGAGVNAWQAIIAVAVTMDQGGVIQANFGCTQFFGNGVKLYSFRMLINGQVMSDFGGVWSWINGFPNVSSSINVGPGTFVIQVDWWGDSSIQISNKTLFAMGAKR
jgi:predicted phage tail protein